MSVRKYSTTEGLLAPDKNWSVEFQDEFFEEFGAWSEEVQDAVFSQLGKLRIFGPSLGGQALTPSRGPTIPT